MTISSEIVSSEIILSKIADHPKQYHLILKPNTIILMIVFVFLIILWVSIMSPKELFDGTGKLFGEYHTPQPCCKDKNCYPGMYWKPS